MKKKYILLILMIISILPISCYRTVLPNAIDSEDDLLDIYTMSTHIEDFEKTSDIVKKYNLTEKTNWLKYRKLLVELARDIDKYREFKEKSVDKYLKERSQNFEVKYYVTTNYNRNFNPSTRTQEITKEKTETEEKYYKVFVEIIGKRRIRIKLYKAEYYENNKLKNIIYKNEKSRLIKEEKYENGEVKTTYFNLN